MDNDNGTITLNVRDYMDNGLGVFDRNARRIGTVIAYEPTFGYMQVRPHPLTERILHIPFHTITHIDSREVFISPTRAEVNRLYRDPPWRSTRLEKRTDPRTGENDSEAITTEPSGYGGTPVVVDHVPVGKLAAQIAPGFEVLSSELEDLGTVADRDGPPGQLLIESRFPSRRVQTLPTAFVEFVDQEDGVVYIAVSAADLRRLPDAPVEKGV